MAHTNVTIRVLLEGDQSLRKLEAAAKGASATVDDREHYTVALARTHGSIGDYVRTRFKHDRAALSTFAKKNNWALQQLRDDLEEGTSEFHIDFAVFPSGSSVGAVHKTIISIFYPKARLMALRSIYPRFVVRKTRRRSNNPRVVAAVKAAIADGDLLARFLAKLGMEGERL